ncbi:hypothetical protein [Phenylobacterium sp.]|uniref:hypothetical protein n=1 Tax=Phenylobacterium sp. TaxID=1871053 RepID=UPI0035B24FE0
MRPLFGAALALTFACAAGASAVAAEQTPVKFERAAAVGDFSRPASDRGPILEKGYTARHRRIADCLATYPGYDPKTDRIEVAPGVTRPCRLPVVQARR